MPGALGVGWRGGNQSEYLVQYFLSVLGVSAPVLRQEDIGTDFYCALAQQDSHRLTFHSPFMVQTGSAGGKDFIYGGLDDKNKWRKAGIDWLFSQELPLFVATLSRSDLRFKVYSTSPMWLIRNFYDDIVEVELCPDAHHDPVKESKAAEPFNNKGNTEVVGFSYRVPLAGPIVDLHIIDLDNKEKITQARDALASAIRLEQLNLTYRNAGVGASDWICISEPNDAGSHRTGGAVYRSTGDIKPELTRSFKDVAVSMALSFKEQKKESEIANLASAFKLIKRSEVEDWIFNELPDSIKSSFE